MITCFGAGIRQCLMPAVAADGVLVGSGMKEAQVEGFLIPGVVFGKQHLLVQVLRIIIVRMVAADPPDIHPPVFIVPFVHREQDEFFMDRPGIRDGIHQAVVDDIPGFGIILLLLLQDLKDDGSGFSHGIPAKFGKNIRFPDLFLDTGLLDVLD